MLTLRRLKREDRHELEASAGYTVTSRVRVSLNYTVRPYLEKNRQTDIRKQTKKKLKLSRASGSTASA